MVSNNGKLDGVLINNVAMKFDAYKVDLGNVEYTITISGPYDIAVAVIAVQTVYAFVLQLNQFGVAVSMLAIVENISIDDMMRINVTFRPIKI